MIHEFTLTFVVTNCAGNTDDQIGALGVGGCDDALIGLGRPGLLGMMFARESSSAVDAVVSAITDVQRALPGARLTEAVPDLVGLTDVADMLGFSRQNMRKLMTSNPESFPTPVHSVKQGLWHLESLLLWLSEEKQYDIDSSLIELAKVNKSLNLAAASHESDSQQINTFKRLLSESANRVRV